MAERKSPESCQDMASLRALIDGIDDELFDLFAARMACIHRAADLKKAEGLPANVPSRVTEVIANAERRAAARGLDPALYGGIWRAIVDAAIAEEEKHLGGQPSR
ncbi:chorismate mutase [Aureimonas endophytica]|uniref:chorismate mutase n=1 Tax=Aureimonas endophytica TaxID=2027858 RepID=A0A916ZCP0_9HYPH|nr:chorismate mutase [Aureimonas endophytica]GGD88410.1 chorismate mutase [Aureimonas endophytica]